jgi:hypothetical protein
MNVETDTGRLAATSDSWSGGPPAQGVSRTPTIADNYADLLRPLNNNQRRAMVLRLTFGFYEGWRPSRTEMADLVAVELGTLTAEEAARRQQRRMRGGADHGQAATTPGHTESDAPSTVPRNAQGPSKPPL